MRTRRLALLVALLTIRLPAVAVELPSDHSWQVSLRAYLATLQPGEFEIAATEWRLEEDYGEDRSEKLYRDWLILGRLSRLPAKGAFFADAALFTLGSIEREDGVYLFPDPAGLAWWTQLDIAGNPFLRHPGARRRALVGAIVDMIMLESCWADPRNIKPDFMAANIGTWAYTYLHARELLPTNTQRDFERGMLYYLAHMVRLAPRDGNTNMDMREIATLATLDEVFSDADMHARLVRDARRILFGGPQREPATSDPMRGTFHAAGYIGEADGPETSYNGISLFHLLEAATATHGDPDWDAFMPEVIRRMLRFKAYNTFPEPDGRYDGPSSWAKRTNFPYPYDQRNRPWRHPAAAMLSDEGFFLLGVDPQTYEGGRAGHYADRDTLLEDVKKGVRTLNDSQRKAAADGRVPEPERWEERHWPADLPYTWDYYVDGAYDRFTRAIGTRNELLRAPFERAGDFSISFDDEFWVAKDGDWGFQVEAVPHMGRSYDTGGSGALAGGSLAAFWTRAGGLAVVGRLPDKWNYVTWRPPSGEDVKPEHAWSVDRWPTHHLWGRTDAGHAFSSARQRDPWVSYELEADPPVVSVTGYLGTPRTVEPDGELRDVGHILYRRRFEKLPDGLRVTSELLSRGEEALEHRGKQEDRRDRLTELWETLPIYLGPVPRQEGGTPPDHTTIEWLIGDAWQDVETTVHGAVRAVRVTRFGSPVVIEFGAPQRVKVTPVISTVYQKRDRLRNLVIDLLGSGGAAVTMPGRAAVTYVIRPGGDAQAASGD